MIPAGLAAFEYDDSFYLWLLACFTLFFILEQFLHWHHCHRASAQHKQPPTYLILLGDDLHNFIGGLAIAGTFLIDIRAGFMAWLAVAAHEIPQELGDLGVLVNGGWNKSKALLFNVLSAMVFLIGRLIGYLTSFNFNINFLIPFTADKFLYIGAPDLAPEVNKHADLRNNGVHLIAFIIGALLIWSIKLLFET